MLNELKYNFIKLQKQNLRIICDVFMTISRQFLNVETYVQSIEFHLIILQTKTRMKLYKNVYNVFIKKHCNKIKRKLTFTRNHQRRSTSVTLRKRNCT